MPRRMPRVSSVGLSLLLMAAGLAFATAGNNVPPLLNPWLSSNDLQLTDELRAICSSSHTTSTEEITSSACPPPCPATVNSNSTQCLYYLKESHKEEVCGRDLGVERRREVLHGLRMRHCCEHAVDGALPEIALLGGAPCRQMLDELLVLDNLAGQAACINADLLSRYDCGQPYTRMYRCKDCKDAYRRWVCSTFMPHFTRSGRRVRPCLGVCQDVERQCPFLLPGDITIIPGETTTHPTPQYAGEPTFLCLDLNIPLTGQQRLRSSHVGEEDCCYSHCGSPGRGGGTMELCEHCPGRPANKEEEEPSIATRTHHRTSVLIWTAWIFVNAQNQIKDLIKCLLVMCAISVRTTLTWTKNAYRSCS
ncbi:transmembrane protein FAM155A [Coccinella septempunctata]|uniref:transmembrane protein FAM155A n=1 Tax=Coccinella septempunctata TaxID=41139 RepID=UPI001D087A4D|nr:transmembrane protein FAM155A [Coccinella septempunctata]